MTIRSRATPDNCIRLVTSWTRINLMSRWGESSSRRISWRRTKRSRGGTHWRGARHTRRYLQMKSTNHTSEEWETPLEWSAEWSTFGTDHALGFHLSTTYLLFELLATSLCLYSLYDSSSNKHSPSIVSSFWAISGWFSKIEVFSKIDLLLPNRENLRQIWNWLGRSTFSRNAMKVFGSKRFQLFGSKRFV